VGIVEGGCVYRTEVAAGGVHRPHALQLLVSTCGDLAANVDGIEMTIPSGNAVLISPDVPRVLHQGVLRVAMLFDPESLGASFRAFARSATATVLSGAVGKRLQALACDLCEARTLDSGTVEAVLSEGRGILERAGLMQPFELDERVRTAIELYRRPWLKLDHPRIARRAGISPDHLSHMFKEQVGISAKQYALWVRTVAAVERVYEGASVTQAAKEVEFADVAHFSRACHRHLGHSPSRLPVQHPRVQRRTIERSGAQWSVALTERLDRASFVH
jgi:AraC-like DNA-binding protein